MEKYFQKLAKVSVMSPSPNSAPTRFDKGASSSGPLRSHKGLHKLLTRGLRRADCNKYKHYKPQKLELNGK